MKIGLLLDNCQSGQGEQPAESSYRKLATMGASAIGTLWTGGTRHDRTVYERCEATLSQPTYLLRIDGGERDATTWLQHACEALAEVPRTILDEGRLVLACQNEPNINPSVWLDNPEGYGELYRSLAPQSASVPIYFAAPSLGADSWQDYWRRSYSAAGPLTGLVLNTYDFLLSEVEAFARLGVPVWIGEVNTLRPDRVGWLRQAFGYLAGFPEVKATLVFIAGGRSNDAWDERYIVSEDEAAGLAGAMPPEQQEDNSVAVDEAVKYYSQTWAAQRIANGEDPRDTMAFVQHLKDVNAQWQNPELYGLPFVVVRPG